MEKKGLTAEDMARLGAAFRDVLVPALSQACERLTVAFAVISPAIGRAEEREWELIRQRARQQRFTLIYGGLSNLGDLAYVDNLSGDTPTLTWDGAARCFGGSPDETIGATLDDLIGRNDELERTMREDLGIQ